MTTPALPATHVAPTALARREPLSLVERLAEDMARRWRAGDEVRAEEYFTRHPQLLGQPEAALELIAEEMSLRSEAGREPEAREFGERFPQWRRQVLALLGCHRLLTNRAPANQFPEIGERLGDFRVLAELGRGAQGRVFLAAQVLLADRPVVLKLGSRFSGEHLALSRLQHSHIVPLFSAHDFPKRGLRGLCLPYFGGATLAELLRALRSVPAGQRSGVDLLRTLVAVSGPDGPPISGPACRFLARASYVEAICWLGACLADALHYAHEHGLLHLDVKPSNVLMAADGEPMLLDFHLARPPLAAGEEVLPGGLGGTPGYMPPEQRTAMETGQTAAGVDGRADIYALGALMVEALGGSIPVSDNEPGRLLRQCNPLVTPGLADLLTRCTHSDPERRYSSAAEVADDLRRHMGDLLLRGVANRSVTERWRKWRRRRPRLLPLLALLLTAAAATGWWALHAVRQGSAAEAALRDGETHLREQRFAEAADAFRYSAALIEDLPFHDETRRRLRDGADQAERGRLAADLHTLCERLRPLYGADALSSDRTAEIETRCRDLWRQRDMIIGRISTSVMAEEKLRSDLLDLAIIYASIHVRAASRDQADIARTEALDVLSQAEALLGPSCVLCQERHDHALALGRVHLAEEAARGAAAMFPRGPWEHYALGRAYLRAGDLTRAAELLERAVAMDPHAVWPNFSRGIVAYRAGQYEDAVLAFSACVALAPRDAACVFNRGWAFAKLGRFDRAAKDFEVAAQLDPTLAAEAPGRIEMQGQRPRPDSSRPSAH